MKVLITGVAGFVGSNLLKLLLTNGCEVVGVDNFSFGFRRNIEPFLTNKKFTFYEKDLRDIESLTKIKCDVIVHLASQKIPRYSTALCTLEDNASMLKNVINKCKKDKIKLVFASTSDVYGKNPILPYHEESDLLLGPTTVKRWAYALSKIYAEQLIIANNQEFDLEFTIMRFFGSYGVNQNTTWWGGPQSVFIQNILEDKPIEIHGDGSQTRTFTYVADTVQGVEKCIFHQNSKNEIFNIASEPTQEITILNLAKLIWKLMKDDSSAPNIKMIPYSTFGKYEDVMRRVPSIDKIKQKLDYEPKFNLEQGLTEAIKWQSNLLAQPI
ncbi:MAG: NAD-dependent epimerase/dehydratase family protein [Bacteroidetes bacterium]|nr:NAD-dependent epimerase/dehydratase family protein [Bacteroidota bacterium]